MVRKPVFALGIVSLAMMLSDGALAAVGRTFVSTAGNDGNTAMSCAPTSPCRSFNAALSVTNPGGEVIVLDSGGYGPAPINITQSVSITAPDGVYAGITVSSAGAGIGIAIATAGVNVTLTGLTINGQGATYGISMTDGDSLTIQNSVISNFGFGGVYVSTPARVRIVNTTVRNNLSGILLNAGALADIVRSQVLGNSSTGVYAESTTAGTSLTVTDTLVSGTGGSSNGVYAFAQVGGTVKVSLIRSTIANAGYGVISYSNFGTALLTISDCMVTGNNIGLYRFQSGNSGAFATLETLSNNTVRQNGTNVSGTITAVSPM